MPRQWPSCEVTFNVFPPGDRCEVDYPWKHIGPGICMFVTSLQKSWDGAITYCASIHPRSQLPVLKDVSSVEYLHYTMSSLGKGSQEIWLNAFYDSVSQSLLTYHVSHLQSKFQDSLSITT